ncbi:MAG TPA: formate dehydrogenase accessory sulfurtransferase FdhD, partial [Desulfobacteria bacterium]|nr:formate dehydrogenase accessory sulfurtransferase FdhD [Desulfobacteria bacterium]
DMNKGLAWVETSNDFSLGEKLFLKRYLTSCCGKGRSSFYFANDARLTKPITGNLAITTEQILSYSSMLDNRSELFHLTGGVHGGAICGNGAFDYFAADIGRHNVLDKLYGQAFLAGVDLSTRAITFSGRVSSEILIKATKMGCPVLIGRSAPTDLALKLADQLGVTVVGFARADRMNIYTHPERIVD